MDIDNLDSLLIRAELYDNIKNNLADKDTDAFFPIIREINSAVDYLNSFPTNTINELDEKTSSEMQLAYDIIDTVYNSDLVDQKSFSPLDFMNPVVNPEESKFSMFGLTENAQSALVKYEFGERDYSLDDIKTFYEKDIISYYSDQRFEVDPDGTKLSMDWQDDKKDFFTEDKNQMTQDFIKEYEALGRSDFYEGYLNEAKYNDIDYDYFSRNVDNEFEFVDTGLDIKRDIIMEYDKVISGEAFKDSSDVSALYSSILDYETLYREDTMFDMREFEIFSDVAIEIQSSDDIKKDIILSSLNDIVNDYIGSDEPKENFYDRLEDLIYIEDRVDIPEPEDVEIQETNEVENNSESPIAIEEITVKDAIAGIGDYDVKNPIEKTETLKDLSEVAGENKMLINLSKVTGNIYVSKTAFFFVDKWCNLVDKFKSFVGGKDTERPRTPESIDALLAKVNDGKENKITIDDVKEFDKIFDEDLMAKKCAIEYLTGEDMDNVSKEDIEKTFNDITNDKYNLVDNEKLDNVKDIEKNEEGKDPVSSSDIEEKDNDIENDRNDIDVENKDL